MDKKNDNPVDKQIHDQNIDAVKNMLKKSKKGALSLAVAFTISTTITGCNNVNKTDDPSYYVGSSRGFSDQDTSSNTDSQGHYYGGHYFYGGSYFYGRGATYRSGSWGTASSNINKSSGGATISKSGLGGSSYKGAGG